MARILIVDDDAAALCATAELLRLEGHEVLAAADGAQALLAAEEFLPDVVITDLAMPGLGGFAFIQALRERPAFVDVPVLVVSAHDQTALRVEGFNLGADDFLSKPVDFAELIARVERQLVRSSRQKNVAHQSVSDELTNMLNRRGITNFFMRQRAVCKERGQPVSLLMLDVDRFKSINDRLGHAVGDLALCAVARVLQDAVRASDRVGRLGGDEFLIVLPGVTPTALAELQQRLRQQHLPLALDLSSDESLWIDCSIGGATATDHDSFETVVARADAAMYRDKAARHGSTLAAESRES